MKRRILAVGIDFAFRAGAGLMLASPVVAAVASTGVTRFPEGDRLLFEPGGLMLVEVMRALWSAFFPLVRTELVTGTLLVIALVLPYSLLLVALSRDEPLSMTELWGRACVRAPALLSLKGLTVLAQALAGFLTLGLASLVRASLAGATSRAADLAALAVVGLGALLVLGLGAWRDLSSAAAVLRATGSRKAVAAGLAALVRSPAQVAKGSLGPALAGLALVVSAAWLTGILDVSRPGAWRLGLVLAVHQSVVLGLCVCRAWWLSHASRLVETQDAALSSARR